MASEADVSSQTNIRHQSPNAHLTQHYRHQPPAEESDLLGSDLDEQIGGASSDGMSRDDASSDAEGDANTWLADPAKGELKM